MAEAASHKVSIKESDMNGVERRIGVRVEVLLAVLKLGSKRCGAVHVQSHVLG